MRADRAGFPKMTLDNQESHMQNQECTQQPEQSVNDHAVGVDGKNGETRRLPLEQHDAIDADLTPITEEISQQISFDRYEVIGLLLMMYGWWKMLAQSWFSAIILIGIGWLLAFATGTKRDTFIRVITGICADVVRVGRSLVYKGSSYIAEKKKDQSANDGK